LLSEANAVIQMPILGIFFGTPVQALKCENWDLLLQGVLEQQGGSWRILLEGSRLLVL